MIVLAGADLVLPGGVQSEGTLVIDGERIGALGALGAVGASGALGADAEVVDLRGHIVVPGFIDVHVHGLEGLDTLDGGDVIAAIAERLPKFGVTGFCPTTVACAPDALREVLRSVALLRTAKAGSRVLPAHLESNFINPEYRGAQPIGCIRSPLGALGLPRRPPSPKATASLAEAFREGGSGEAAKAGAGEFHGRDIVDEIDSAGDNVGIVTLAPELDGAVELIAHLVSSGRRVSLGHSAATCAQARAAIDAGARHATHLFNRMPPLGHREPGLAGAVLTSAEIAAEIICDGVHVHRDMVRMAIAAKGASRMMGITDGVAAAGLPDGSTASLGGRPIRVRNSAAYLEDGTLAGSVATMDRVFRFLIHEVGLSLTDAVQLCATTPASELGLIDRGSLVTGALADLVVLDRDLIVKRTYISGRLIYGPA